MWIGWILPTLCLLLVASVTVYPQIACDLWWQLKTGELIWTNRAIPREDVFSHTATGQPWYVQEWLAELFFYGLYRFIGPEALIAYKMIGPLLAYGIVLWRCWLRCGSTALAAGVTALAALAVSPFFDIRPQLFTYLLFSASLLLLEQWRHGRWERGIWLMPVLTVCWVNLHGAFMLVFALLGVEIAAECWEWVCGRLRSGRLRTLLGVTLLCALAGMVSPHGFDGYRYAFLLLGHTAMLNDIQEWLSPSFRVGWELPLGWSILLLAVSMMARHRINPRDMILLAGLAHSMLYSMRHAPLFAIATAPIVAEGLSHLTATLREWMRTREWSYPRWSLVGGTALGLILTYCIGSQVLSFPRKDWFDYCTAAKTSFPVAACDFLMKQPAGGRLYQNYSWGGYCVWRLWPRHKVFIDGRAEVYFNAGYKDFFDVQALKPGWMKVLDRWNVDLVMVDTNHMITHYLRSRPDWRLIYEDKQAMILRRVPVATPAKRS
jgi:hypothetical protein